MKSDRRGGIGQPFLEKKIRQKDFYQIKLNISDKKMSEEISIGKRYTLVIPKKIREELGLEEGQRTLVYVEGERIVIEPLPSDPFEILDEIVGESYDEVEEERRVERWLKEHAGR